jgi:exodeoxyribonuclease VII small subunit
MHKMTHSTKPSQAVQSAKPVKKSLRQPPQLVVPPTYQALKTELDAVMTELQREDLDIDTALTHYRRGLELVRQLEEHLNGAENTVHELKTTFTVSPTSR